MENLKVKPSTFGADDIVYSKVYGIEINMYDCTTIGDRLLLENGEDVKVFAAYAEDSDGVVGMSILKDIGSG